MSFYTLRYHDLVCDAALSEQQAKAVLAFLREADGFCPSMVEAPQSEDDCMVAYAVEYDGGDGRRIYQKALPARTAFAAARQMAADQLDPIVHRCTILISQTSSRQRKVGRWQARQDAATG